MNTVSKLFELTYYQITYHEGGGLIVQKKGAFENIPICAH